MSPIGASRRVIQGAGKGVPEPPSTVVHQYVAENFASPWLDEVGSADMAVNGMTASTFSNGQESVSGDGTDDYGQSNGPEDLPQNKSFGIAFTFVSSDTSDPSTWFSSRDINARLSIVDIDFFSGSNGQIATIVADDNGNQFIEETDSAYVDGNIHAVIINKVDNSRINFYVDTMTNAVNSTTQQSQGFDHSNYTNSFDMTFFAENDSGTIQNYKDMEFGAIEFNTETYTEQERKDFVARRPEV